MRALVGRDLADASVSALLADRQFATRRSRSRTWRLPAPGIDSVSLALVMRRTRTPITSRRAAANAT
jgi:hypothetical protein